MKLSETGYTKEEIIGLVKKYMIDTYERFPMVAEREIGRASCRERVCLYV